MQRIDAIKAIALNLRDLTVDSIPASLTGSSVDVAKLVHPVTDQIKGQHFYIYSGAGAGQDRVITNFTPANNRMTFDEVFSTTPSINSNFIITQFFTKDEYDNVVDRAIGLARLSFLEEKVATLQIVATQYEYAVPSGYDYISTLRLVPTGSSDYETEDYVDRIFELPPRYWRIEANPLGSFVIAIDPRKISLDNFDEDWLRVMGQAKPVVSGTDNATIPDELEEFVVNDASMRLSSQRIDEKQEWQAKFRMFRDAQRDLQEYIYRPRRGKPVG